MYTRLNIDYYLVFVTMKGTLFFSCPITDRHILNAFTYFCFKWFSEEDIYSTHKSGRYSDDPQPKLYGWPTF